jgi:hypothetical protein
VVKIADPSVILQSKENTDLVLEIIDMSGRSVYRKKVRVNKGVNLIDLANLRASTGYYVLAAGTGRDMITHKMILQ